MNLTWKVEWDDKALKELKKLAKPLQKSILTYIRNRIATDQDPRRFGKPLAYDKYGLWRYRIENARIVCRIYDNEVRILVVRVGHRKNIYL